MADMWTDDDCPEVRAAFGHALRAGYTYQSGSDSEAPALIFADADYEVGDGKHGLWEDGKYANEPAITYVRADAYLSLLNRAQIPVPSSREHAEKMLVVAEAYLRDATQNAKD